MKLLIEPDILADIYLPDILGHVLCGREAGNLVFLVSVELDAIRNRKDVFCLFDHIQIDCFVNIVVTCHLVLEEVAIGRQGSELAFV